MEELLCSGDSQNSEDTIAYHNDANDIAAMHNICNNIRLSTSNKEPFSCDLDVESCLSDYLSQPNQDEISRKLSSIDEISTMESHVQVHKERYISDEEIFSKIDMSVNKNTAMKRQWATNKFTQWLTRQPSCVPSYTIEKYSDSDFNNLIPRFILQVRDNNGCKYKPKSLFELTLSLQQYINSKRILTNHSQINFLKDQKFATICGILDSEMKIEAKEGNAICSKKSAGVITEEMEELLWQTGVLGTKDPNTLRNTLLYLIGVNFALRGVQEHTSLKLSHFAIVEIDNIKTLRYTETSSKTYSGGISCMHVKPKVVSAFPNNVNSERCVVKLYEKYLAHRPENVNRLYLKSLNIIKDEIWYSSQPLGINTVKKVVSQMCRKAGFNGFFSNHSLRATAATRLFQHGVEEQLVAEVTGHRSTVIRNYKRPNMTQLRNLSNIIQCNKDICKPVQQGHLQTFENLAQYHISSDGQSENGILSSNSNGNPDYFSSNSSTMNPSGNDAQCNVSEDGPTEIRYFNCQSAKKTMKISVDGNNNKVEIIFS